ncbi:hypothetical protein [Paraflavitalea speifideaquila]|uniref:hypothetical protein n=1 Tax=Paraflavitalea speifideaquila TaxID=3076558 RepID=UPI0028EBD8D9|nr:hypothetical protein [Paraflavitalea speifideiaquila]
MERKVSYHLSDVKAVGYKYHKHFEAYAQALPVLCAYELNADNIVDAIEEAAEFQRDIFDAQSELDSYCVMEGVYSDDCPEGVVIQPQAIRFIKKGKYFAE